MNSQTDGEYRTDVPTGKIPPADTWDKLSINQLIDAKNELTNKLFFYKSNEVLAKHLTSSITRLDALISSRNASS